MNFHLRHLGVLALAALMLLGPACIMNNSCPEQKADAGDASTSDQQVESLTLTPGGTVTGVDRVTLGAPEGTIDQPVEIRIERGADLEQEPPLPEHVQAVGEPYEIGASRAINTPGDTFLLLGLPVPAGVSTDNLAVAVLVPRGEVEDDGEGAEGPIWSVIRGKFDPQGELFGTLVPYLGATKVFMLVSGDDYSDQESAETGQQEQSLDGIGFRVRCIGFAEGQCTADHRDQTEAALTEIFHHYVGELGFRPPRLRISLASVGFFPLQWAPGFDYEYELRRAGSTCRGGGYYVRTTRQIVTCFNFPDSPRNSTTRHEFFHALQYAYPAFFDNGSQRERVVVEATARLAEMSTTELSRSSGSAPRRVTTSLFRNVGDSETADQHDYHAQDFFLFLGKRIGGHIDYLIPLFQRGGLRADLEDLLQSGAPYPAGYSIGEVYWEWARNMAFEKSLSLGEWDGSITGQPVPEGDPCAFYSSVAAVNTVRFSPSSGAEKTNSFEVAPLASRVIRLDFVPTDDAYWTTAQITSSSADLRVKFYDDAERGTTNCIDRPDAGSHIFTVSGSWAIGYALVSNTGLTDDITLQLTFTEPEVAPVPIAQDDFITTLGNGVITIHALANDKSPSGSALTLIDIGQPDNGSATLSATGQRIAYQPDSGFDGLDTFSYTVRNEEGLEATATVQVTVAGSFRVVMPTPLEGKLDMFHGVNTRGQAALNTILEDGRQRAQFLREDTSFLDLGTLGGSESAALDLNDQGIVVGWSDTAGELRRAFIWDTSSGMRDLGALGGGSGSVAMGVNEQGLVVGASEADASGFRAALWQGVGQIVDVGAQLAGNSMATGIDNSQPSPAVVGYHISDAITYQPAPQAFLWVDANGNAQAEATEFVMLGTLGGDGSMALGINEAGQIVGQSQTVAGNTSAFLWQDGTMTQLGSLGGEFSTANAINGHGQVVGEAERSDGSRRAFLWSEGVMMEVSDDLMPPGWVVLSLGAINDSGQMAGTARDPSGNNRAVLLIPSLSN